MKSLEDAWQKIVTSDEYNNYNDDVKAQVKQRFFEKTIGASKSYASAAPEIQQKIQQRFEERINPSTISKLEKAGKNIGAMVEAEGGVGNSIRTVFEQTPAGTVDKKLGELGHKAVQSIDKSTAGETVTPEQYSKAIPQQKGDSPFEKANIEVAALGTEVRNATVRTGKKMLEGAIPESTEGVAATAAMDPALEIAKGLPVLGADVGEMSESIIGKFRGQKTLPPIRLNNPLAGLLDDEKAYEAKLKEMSGMSKDPLYEPFTPQVKVNVSQLHDYRQGKLIDARAEDPHLKKLAQAEEDTAYQKKLESMPGADKKQPSLIPFKQMLQPGQEGKLMGSAQYKEAIDARLTPEVKHTMENIAGMDKSKDPFMEDKWQRKAEHEGAELDPDVKKFRERNLTDITQKPLRNILKEINDDLGHIGSVRFGPSDEDPAVLEAAKDLRVAVRLPNGSIYKDKVGADAHAQVVASAKSVEGAVEGFWDELSKKFYSREESAKMLGWSDQRIKQSGGLMAQNLRDLHENWRKLGEKGEVRLGEGRNVYRATSEEDKLESSFPGIFVTTQKNNTILDSLGPYKYKAELLSKQKLFDYSDPKDIELVSKDLPKGIEPWHFTTSPTEGWVNHLKEKGFTGTYLKSTDIKGKPAGEVFIFDQEQISKFKKLGEKGEVSLGGQDDSKYKGLYDSLGSLTKNERKEWDILQEKFVALQKIRSKYSFNDDSIENKNVTKELEIVNNKMDTLQKIHEKRTGTGPDSDTDDFLLDPREKIRILNKIDARNGGSIIDKNLPKKLGEKGEVRIGAGGRAPVRAVGQDDYDVLNAAKDLRVALRHSDGKVEVGNFGESHAEAFADKVPDRYAMKAEFGFYDNITKKFVSREEAASYLGPKRNSLMGEELGDLHRAGMTYLGKAEKGLHSEDIAKIKEVGSKSIIKQINKEFGEKGHVWADADPERYDRIKQNVRELLRRAHKVGYDATDEVAAYADRNYVSKEELHFIKDELHAEEPAPLDPRPISEMLQAAAGQPDAKRTLWEKVKDRWKPDGAASKVKTLLTKRYGEIAEGQLDSQYFIHNTLKQLTKTEREAMSFKGVAPEMERFRWPNNKEIIQLIKKPTENMKKADIALTKYMEEAHSFLSENFDDIGYVKNYVTQLWDKPSDVLLNPHANQLGTYNPFMQKRSFPDYASGINAGQQPKTLDIKEIVSAYDKYKIKTVANVKFFEELAKMPTPQGVPAVLDAKRAPIGWIKADDVPALVGKRVHPDYLQAVKVITDAPFSNKALRAYDLLGESQRYASLTLSPFHFGSLFVNGSLSTDIPFKVPLKVLSSTGKYIMREALDDKSEASMWSKVLTAYKDGHAAFADLPLAKRATRAGLNIGMIGQQQIGPLENFLMGTEAKLNKFYLGKGIKAVRGAMDILNKPMWDYFHAGMKIMTFEEHLTDNMRKFPDMPIQELERKTASYVNDLDGGEAWETLFVSPQYQKAMHRAFFFPDWMVSRLRTLGEVAKPVGLDSIKNATTRSPEAYQAQKYWLRAGVGYYTFANWMNYNNTKKAYGQGRFMWDNDPGKTLDVFSKTDEGGRALYNNYAPAITEVFKWFHDPIKSLGARFNPNLQLMTEFFTGTTLSGYKLPETQRSFTSIMKRHYAPIIMSGSNEAGLFPTSKGMSSYEVVKRFEGVIQNGDDPETAIKYGTQNGYDIEKLYNIAQRNVRGKMRKEALQP